MGRCAPCSVPARCWPSGRRRPHSPARSTASPDAQIAERFAPRLVLHPEERWAPTSARRAARARRDARAPRREPRAPAPLDPATLPGGSSCVGGLPCAWALRLGCGLVASKPCPAPVDAPRLIYARVVRRHPARGSAPGWLARPDRAHAVSRARGRRAVLALLARRRLALEAAQRRRCPAGARCSCPASTSITRATGRP